MEIEPECEPEPEGPAEAGAAESGIEPELDMKEASPEETFQPSALDRWAEIRAQLHSDASLADALWLSNSEPDVVFGHVLPIEPQPAPAKESDAASAFEVEANTHAGSAPEAEPAENAAIELEAGSGEPDAIEIIADVFPQMDEDHTAVPEEELAVAASPPEAIAEDLAAQVDEAETVEQPVAVEGPEPASTANIIDPVVESGEDEMPEPRLKASGNVKLEAIDGARVGAKFLGKSVLLGAAGARCLMDRFDLPVGTHVKLSLIAPRFVDQIDVPDAIVLGADPVQGKFQVQVAFAERHDELETFVLQHFGNKPPPGGFFSRFRR